MSRLINLLALLPSTTLTLLIISIAFLRVYDGTDFVFLGQLTDPKTWSNRLTVAALVVALVNLGVEWNRRNRETDRLAQAEHRRNEEEQRRTESAERETRRTRIEIERDLAFLTFLGEPSDRNRQRLAQTIVVLSAY